MINFMAYNKKMLFVSFVFALISIFSIATKGFNFSIDFSGGNITELKFAHNVKTEQISKLLTKTFSEVLVTHYGSMDAISVQTSLLDDNSNVGETIYNILKKDFKNIELTRTEFVGPKVGEELKTNGLLALVLVIVGILIYVSLSFEFTFAVSGVIALLHDLILMLGFISFFGVKVDLTALAAVMALLGYSLNDTIIVFDRIRENLGIYKDKSKFSLINIINFSINETLSRTIVTSSITLVTLFSLLLLGGESLHGFSLVFIIGIIVGTYSSIYIAGGILSFFEIETKERSANKENTESGII